MLTASNGDVVDRDDAPIDTQRIQAAIDGCPSGSGVELRRTAGRDAFVSAPLELRAGVTLVIAAGATLYASRNPRDYDVEPVTCGRVDRDGHGCRPLIHVAGHDTAIMGDGAIDGRGGAMLLGGNGSWWDLAQEAKRTGGSQSVPRLIVADHADNFVLYRITLRNSPNFHVLVSRTNGFTAWGVTIDAPRTARNTDGIDPSSSTDVSILYSRIRCGDDNVAIKAPAGGSASHITIAHDRFYSGHGMSIGSETAGGVDAVDVRDLTIDGADNGLRIKSNATRGGLVHDIVYTDICIRDVTNPLVIDSFYDRVTTGSLVPRFEAVQFHDVHIAGGGVVTIAGTDTAHAARLIFDGVLFDGSTTLHASHAHIDRQGGGTNLPIDGADVTLSGRSEARPLTNCAGRFVPFEQGVPR